MGLRGGPDAGANDEDPLADAEGAGAGSAADELAAELEEDDSGRVANNEEEEEEDEEEEEEEGSGEVS